MGVRDLFVANIKYDANEADLRALFETVGVVTKVKLVFQPDGRSRGLAFIRLYDDDAERAIAQLDGYTWRGRQLHVVMAEPRKHATSPGVVNPRASLAFK